MGLDHFDLLAPYYERFIKPKTPQGLIDALGLPEGAPILDVGGGTGRVAQYFAENGHHVTLADLSPKMLEQASSKPGITPMQALAEALPFADGSFSAVIMVDALHHVHSQKGAVAELWRVLAPGGTIVIEEPDLRRPFVKLLAVAEKLLLMRSHFLSPHAIQDLFPLPSRISITEDGFNAWIAAHKPSPRKHIA